MNDQCVTLRYDVERFPFQKVLAAQVFRCRDLSRLHEIWQERTGRDRLVYADNLKLRRRMQRLPDNALFYRVYHRWITEVVATQFGGQISYSAHPKMRVHLAGTGSVSDFHCDADITGREDQINCYLPFTDVFDGCSVWSETDYGKGDFAPLNLAYGEALLWDGGRLNHGTYANDSGSTRISCDFRFHSKRPERVLPPYSEILSGRTQVA